MPFWTRDELAANRVRSDRDVAICRELDTMRLSRKADALVSDIEQIWMESEARAEDRILRMVGQVLVQAGAPELFRVAYELATGGTPACGAV